MESLRDNNSTNNEAHAISRGNAVRRRKAEPGYSLHLKTVGWSILVMGISLAAIAILYGLIGHIGPTYSASVMEQQQVSLRKQYSLPPNPPVSKDLLEVPPSLRNLTSLDNTVSIGNTVSTAGGSAS